MKALRALTLGSLVGGLMLVGAGGVQAQATVQGRVSGHSSHYFETSKIMGVSVQLENNVSYGKVENFVLNEDGCIQYVVIAYESDYAFVPWSVVHYEQDVVRVDITRERIRDVTFQKGRVPDFASTQFAGRVQKVFGGNRSERGRARSSERGTTETQEPRRENNRPRGENNRNSGNSNAQPGQNRTGQQQNPGRPQQAPNPNQGQNSNPQGQNRTPPAPSRSAQPAGQNQRNGSPNQPAPGNGNRRPNDNG